MLDWTWIKDLQFDSICQAARERKPYALARYGDGEWNALLKLKSGDKRNCDWHQYFPAMGYRLKETLLSKPGYTLGMQRFATELYPSQIHRFITTNGLQFLNWVYSDAMHKSSMKGTLPLLAKECLEAVWIGPDHLKVVADRLQKKAFVSVPKFNAWEQYNRIESDALDAVHKRDLVIVSCGMPAKVLISVLQKHRPEATIIDTGAVWDPYAGVRSRKYMQEGEFSLDSLFPRGTR